jgi:hypothetical protein
LVESSDRPTQVKPGYPLHRYLFRLYEKMSLRAQEYLPFAVEYQAWILLEPRVGFKIYRDSISFIDWMYFVFRTLDQVRPGEEDQLFTSLETIVFLFMVG